MDRLGRLVERFNSWAGALANPIYYFAYTPACWRLCIIIGSITGAVAASGLAMMFYPSFYILGIAFAFCGIPVTFFAFMFRYTWKSDAKHRPRVRQRSTTCNSI